MSLGSNNAVSKTEFIEAMRAVLEAKQAGSGANVDKPDVSDNLGALGTAVYRINTVHAEVVADAAQDADFFNWINQVNTWLNNLRHWQQSLITQFNHWSPTTPAEQNFRNAVLGIADPGNPPAVAPSEVNSRIE